MLGLVRDAWAGARPGAPTKARTHGEVCEVFNRPHTQVSLDLSALCEVCEVCEVLDEKINWEQKIRFRPLGTGAGEEKTRLALKTSHTAHTSHNACFMRVFACEVFVGAKNAHTGRCELSICPRGREVVDLAVSKRHGGCRTPEPKFRHCAHNPRQ